MMLYCPFCGASSDFDDLVVHIQDRHTGPFAEAVAHLMTDPVVAGVITRHMNAKPSMPRKERRKKR